MNFDELDSKMRVYEQSIDQVLLPELYLAARLDGNRFTRLTKELCHFEAPFDMKFRDMMVETVKSLMNYGFRVIYGYTESDEISLLFHPEENTFGRNVRKYNSILAGVASASFSMSLGQQAAAADIGKSSGLFSVETGRCSQEFVKFALLLVAS